MESCEDYGGGESLKTGDQDRRTVPPLKKGTVMVDRTWIGGGNNRRTIRTIGRLPVCRQWPKTLKTIYI